MSRFFKNRNLSADYREESGKKESRFQTTRVSAEITASSKILDATPLSFYNEQLPPCLTTGNRFFFNTKHSESPVMRKIHKSAHVSRIVHTSQDIHRSKTAPVH